MGVDDSNKNINDLGDNKSFGDDLKDETNLFSQDINERMENLSKDLNSILLDIQKAKQSDSNSKVELFEETKSLENPKDNETTSSLNNDSLIKEDEIKKDIDNRIDEASYILINPEKPIQTLNKIIDDNKQIEVKKDTNKTNANPTSNDSWGSFFDEPVNNNNVVSEEMKVENEKIAESLIQEEKKAIKNEIPVVVEENKKEEEKEVETIKQEDKKEDISENINVNEKKSEEKVVEIKKEETKEKTKALKTSDDGSGNNNNKKPKKPVDNDDDGDNKRPKAKTITFVFAILSSIALFLCICAGVGAIVFAKNLCEGMPEFSPADLESADSTIVYDSEGNQIIELGLYLRENIEYDELPTCVIDAFVAAEDSRFFEHFGLDIPRFTKAILEVLKTRSFGQGGSTFTMQLCKLSYFQIDDGENSTMAAREGMAGIRRKMQEIVLAFQAERRLSKKEILSLYLNKVNFGDNIRGIQKAAEYYFGKDVNELNISESAFLAGIVNAPNGNNPYNAAYGNIDYLNNANERKNEVLDLMKLHGYITEDEWKINRAVKIENLVAGKEEKFFETNTYYQSFIDAVINEAQKVTGKNPYTTAMNIYTSMDPTLQEYVYNMQNHPEMFEKQYKFRHELQQNALVVMNNQTGALVALGGGRNQADEARQFNRAVDSYINPGSSIKPVLEYVLAFDRLGYSTAHTVCDRPVFLYETDIVVSNAYGQGYTGDMKITEALARSLNTPAVQLLEEVIDEIGEDAVIEYCQQIGFDSCTKDTFDIQWSIGGRDCLVSPVQLAGAHGMLMHGGKYIAPHTISKIEFRGKYNETPDYIADTEGTQVVSPAAAYMTATCERYNVTSGWINQLDLLKREYPTYAKTGTTNFSEAAYKNYRIPETAAKDQWLCTQTSNYTVVVWNGFDKLEDDAYFTVTDENYNLKCKMGSLLLDAIMERFNYDAKDVDKPDDVETINIQLGCFPYIPGSTEGLISKNSKYATLTTAGEIKKEVKGGHLYHMGAVPSAEGMYIHWDEFNAYLEDGREDLSITSVSGKTTVIATGRSYYPRYTYVNPGGFFATITAASGEVVSVESPTPTALSPVEGEGPYTVCGWTATNPNPVCTVK